MVNTKLHNELIEKEIEKKKIEYDHINQKAKQKVIIEKLKSYAFIAIFVFFVLLLLEVLLWLFPSKHASTSDMSKVQKVVCECNCTKNTQPHPSQASKNGSNGDLDQKAKNSGSNNDKSSLKNGIEYVKHDNFVFERTWKNGVLIKERKLAPTIKDARKKVKHIPQLATPLKKENK